MPPKAGLPEPTQPNAQSQEPPSAVCSPGAKFARSPWGGACEPEGRRWGPGETHLPSPGASFVVVLRCSPPPLTECSAPPGAAGSWDSGHLSWFLPEATANPHYCWSCSSGPRIAPLARGGGALCRQPAGAGTEPGYHRTSGRPLPGGCLRPESYVCATVCISVCVRERECAYVCEQKG